uniref:Uncharacterized protein n=1 Tax=Bicosoecida sp. CB-2014 TaxID=1486930 RepID=A0A7S1G4D1_9STRA|mmetsp:Transcript_12749/g.44667  ORF Transcript_12749/g.44667 Transcript_12749/m.44667 type:complete len:206 (+) Transcript_12749:191-808(+)|eukprot:CAMPEP_0203816112 /NCGR_PEP_ID=MMETSP0115-20131106/14344_1 /ASSEMBLY_ACC=CAM_ASM_000227 /TAXON_ID=33651 /ORGANISM="Bicosoecid sp, Strain ms1" /LENGTH=205 /DNA_ID=CAMNT_0050725011 /DNA_START=170 /DNA_END=787 /DNA_ORIENTATION=+
MADEAKVKRNRFLLRTKEKEDLNQYWYSAKSIAAMAAEVVATGGKACFISTPSIYFSLTKEQREGNYVFDLDTQWEKDPGFVRYDFNEPENFPEELRHAFDMIVVDPPFITREVWEKYATTMRLLAKERSGEVDTGAGGEEEKKDEPPCRFLVSTIAENAEMMEELLGVKPQAFKPSIPNLVYQYNLYANYESEGLSVPNPEIPE